MRVKGITERQRTPRLGMQSKYKRKTIDTKNTKIFVAHIKIYFIRRNLMKITFKKEQIELSQGYDKIYLLQELNAEKLVEILEFCIKNEEGLIIEESQDISPFSHKLCDLIKNGIEQTKENMSE